MTNHASLWDDQLHDPTLEIGPALTDTDIAAWEQHYGLTLPEILKQAYRQQNGGYIRNQAIFVLKLEEVEPVEEGLLDDCLTGEGSNALDPSRMFYLGGDDDQAATLLLNFGEAGASGPSVYAFWSDGAALERVADTVSTLFPTA